MLTFSETPELPLSSLRLIGPVGDTILLTSLTRARGDDHSISASLPLGLLPGNYRLLWKAAGRDGHLSHGELAFFIYPPKRPGSSPQTVGPVAAADSSDTETIAVAGALGSVLSRWLAYVAAFVLIGVMTFRFVVLGRVSPTGNDLFSHIASTNAATLGTVASAGGIVAAMLKLSRESSDMPDASTASMLFDTMWGWSLLLQIAGLLIAGIALYLVHRPGTSRERLWKIGAVGTLILAVSPSLSAHAASSRLALVATPVDMLHILLGGVWLGTLTVIVVVGASAALKAPDAVRPGARVAEMINVFSPLALTCGGTVVLTGLGSSFIELPSLRALWTTPYGVVLLLKLFFVALLFGAGAWNWKRMKPRLTGDNEIAPMQSSASLELMLAVAVLAVTSILVALELP